MKIETREEYHDALKRIDELMDIIGSFESSGVDASPEQKKLSDLADIVIEYEDIHFPMSR